MVKSRFSHKVDNSASSGRLRVDWRKRQIASGAGGRSAEERYRAPLTVDEHAKERERLLVVFALRHQESLWKWPKAQRHGGVAAAAVKGGFHTPTKLGEELQALCEGGEEDLIHAMVLAHRDAEKVTPGCILLIFKSF